jgi:hypothetical protein
MICARYGFVSLAVGIVLGGLVASDSSAQAPGLATKPLLRTTQSGDDTKESVMVSAEFAPKRDG